MEIKENRPPQPPPPSAESYDIRFTPEEVRTLRYFAYFIRSITANSYLRDCALRFMKKTDHLDAAMLDVNFTVF